MKYIFLNLYVGSFCQRKVSYFKLFFRTEIFRKWPFVNMYLIFTKCFGKKIYINSNLI